MDFSVEPKDSIAVSEGIPLTYRHFVTIPAETFILLIINNLYAHKRVIPKNRICSSIPADRNYAHSILHGSYFSKA